MGSPTSHQAILVVDVGSTFTKAALVQVSDADGDETGAVLGRAETPTTLDTDVMDGVRSLAAHLGDCLLYTSPSPRDRTRSRMPSSA